MKETISAVCTTAGTKIRMMKQRPVNYFLQAIFGGLFVGFGIMLIVTIGGLLDPAGVPSMKIIQGLAFGVALSMVMMAGANLFTGDNLVLTVSTLSKKSSPLEMLGIWSFSYIGNFFGALLGALLFYNAGQVVGDTAAYIEKLATAKMNAGFVALLCRGILCNLLVCLAVWCTYKLKTETAKLVMIFCCIFPFVTIGFEHSIANMTLFSLALLIPHGELVSFAGAISNLVPVTLGNIIGGAVIGFVYWVNAKD
ncbi:MULTISPECIES: formate/nitrite transporter family protein [unclassified Lysinibacillus]|uniref:formate/nitrite transporter family protein n=1 Tax=unclassified Lysinibacillus TaxID=2636778 RepID=UPI002556B6B6|nr:MULTISPECIES: formate/nitrite transporter family protein [unclassified Lysinibacillus]MDM5249347.1 formate/nitrite transporter family protein [Lysinibacillus sp. G4S2]